MAPTTLIDSSSDVSAFTLNGAADPRVGTGSLGVRDRLMRGALMLESQIQISFNRGAGGYELRTTSAR